MRRDLSPEHIQVSGNRIRYRRHAGAELLSPKPDQKGLFIDSKFYLSQCSGEIPVPRKS